MVSYKWSGMNAINGCCPSSRPQVRRSLRRTLIGNQGLRSGLSLEGDSYRSYVDPVHGGDNSKDIEQPDSHTDDHHNVENRFNGPLHGDKTIHEPQQQAYDNESDNNLNQWNGPLALLSPPKFKGENPIVTVCSERIYV